MDIVIKNNAASISVKYKHYISSSSTLFTESGLWDFWIFLKVKITIQGKQFESIQDTEVATIVQLKTLTKDFQN